MTCPTCKGYRLKKETLAVKVNDVHIGKITEFSIEEANKFFKELHLSEKDMQIAELILREIDERLGFLVNVGLRLFNIKPSSRNTYLVEKHNEFVLLHKLVQD